MWLVATWSVKIWKWECRGTAQKSLFQFSNLKWNYGHCPPDPTIHSIQPGIISSLWLIQNISLCGQDLSAAWKTGGESLENTCQSKSSKQRNINCSGKRWNEKIWTILVGCSIFLAVSGQASYAFWQGWERCKLLSSSSAPLRSLRQDFIWCSFKLFFWTV